MKRLLSVRTLIVMGLSLLVGLTACVGGKEAATPATAPPASSEPAPTGPSASDWLADLETDATSLYLTSHSCPDKVAAGHCTPKGRFPNSKGDFPPRMKAFPLTLWRYAEGSWENLGQPGVSSYSVMKALPGGLMFVPWTYAPLGDRELTGPLRVSLNEGKTWDDWPIPQEQRRCRSDYIGPGTGGQCTVAVASDYVVIASSYGWIRRNVDSSDWVDITPPKRARLYDFDALDYGLLALADGTLIATVNSTGNIPDSPPGYYRVSRDFGSTWSAPHRNPGKSSQVDRYGSDLYATCSNINFVSGNSPGSSSCEEYLSTDLEHWTKATAGESVTCRRGGPSDEPGRRSTHAAVRVGELVYAIANVSYVKGHEATHEELPDLDLPHRVRHVLERSADTCRTWEQMLNGTRQ